MTLKKAKYLHQQILACSRKIHDINDGGCGIFAKFLHQILSQKGYKCRIICLDLYGSRKRRDHIRNLINIAQKDRDSVHLYNHICLQVGNYYFDSKRFESLGQHNIFDLGYKKLGSISLEKLNYLIRLKDQWNDMYDRTQNSHLKYLLSGHLSDF